MVDTYKTICCPACDRTMKKIFIPSAGISVDICADGCGGLFFDNQELNKFRNPSDDISLIKQELEGKTFIPVDESLTRTCPACGKTMIKTTVGGVNVQIDTCYNCGGIFLDYEELDIIRNNIHKTSLPELKQQNHSLYESQKELIRQKIRDNNNKRTQNMYASLFGIRLYSNQKCYGIFDLLWDIFS